eukprot:361238-Chlamydomonas_euryale.AAC.2
MDHRRALATGSSSDSPNPTHDDLYIHAKLESCVCKDNWKAAGVIMSEKLRREDVLMRNDASPRGWKPLSAH